MRYSAWPARRGIRQHHHRRRGEEMPNFILWNVALELDAGGIFPAFAQGLDVAGAHRMVRAGDYELRVGETVGDLGKSFDQNFWPLICSPFAERENPVLRIAALADIWKLRRSGKNSVFAQMDVFTAVIFQQQLPI